MNCSCGGWFWIRIYIWLVMENDGNLKLKSCLPLFVFLCCFEFRAIIGVIIAGNDDWRREFAVGMGLFCCLQE